MKRVFQWLLQPIVLTLIALILIAVVIWFQGPYLAFDGAEPLEPAVNRWLLIAVMFLVWAVVFAWQWFAARQASQKLAGGVSRADQAGLDPSRQQTDQEIAHLGARMKDAMQMLRSSRGSKRFGRQYLYQIPWYMFVGAPGSGKTTALVHSGLNFPLADASGAAAIGGVGGTRNCDWWFTDDAVLLDTAGRYTTQDSHAEVDKAAWQGFLDLLKKHRKRQPINGVIVAVSVADLLEQPEAARRLQAQAIRERIKELNERLEIEIPVYVMITKCDLLAGFTEFFEDLGKTEREQVWGVTFDEPISTSTDASIASLDSELASLGERLNQRTVDRLQRERDLSRRSLIYRFPQQFALLNAVVTPFITDVFQSNRYEKAPLLRGVYFTSGTQEGSPIDRVFAALAGNFGLTRQASARPAGSGKSYFIAGLLREVIFSESGIAGTNQRFERSRQWVGRGAFALSILLVLAGAGLMINSYLQNQTYVAQVASYTDELAKLAAEPAAKGSALQLVPFLDKMRDIPGGFKNQQDKEEPWFEFGLSQRDKLGSQATDLYHRSLTLTLLPRVTERLEAQLARGSAESLDYLYEVLRSYLMLGLPDRYESDAVAAFVELEFRTQTGSAISGVDPVVKPATTNELPDQALAEHLRNLFNAPGVDRTIAVDQTLVEQSRLALAKLSVDGRIYSRLKRELLDDDLLEFSAVAHGGADATTVLVRRGGAPLTRGVVGLFSKAGHERYQTQRDQAIEQITSDSWVLGKQEALQGDTATQDLRNAIDGRYFADYIRAWDEYLADVGVRELESLNEGARVLNILSGPQSPLLLVLQAAATETSFGEIESSALLIKVPDPVQDRIQELKARLSGVVSKPAASAASTDVGQKQLHPVDKHFAELHRLVKPAEQGAPVPFDQQLAALREVSVFLDAAASAKRQGAPAPPADALNRLKRDSQGLPAPVAAVMQDVANAGSGLTLGGERQRLNALWKGTVAPFCRQALQGRYPMARGSRQEVTHDDFGRLFAPGGMIDDFFQKNLATFVDMSRRPWRMRPGSDLSLGVSKAVIRQFQRAAQIRDTFFVAGARSASLRFELVPVAMDPLLTQFRLDIDGQLLAYSHGPVRPTSFQWPASSGTSLVRAEFLPPASNGSSTLSVESPWALFRMLDQTLLTPTSQRERYRAQFTHQGRRMELELRAGSVSNPFDRRMLESFRCPTSL